MFLKSPEYYLFLVKLLLVFFAGGLVIAGMIQKRFNVSGFISRSIVVLLGVGFAPYWIATILYYSLLILPGNSDMLYLFLAYGSLIAMGVYARKSIVELLCYIADIFSHWRKNHLLLTIGGIGVFIMFLLGWSWYISSKSLTEHDVLEYAVQGKVFYTTKVIGYSAHRLDELSGFYYVGLHGFSFPLQATNERLLNGIFHANSDYYFRALNSIYGMLILVGLFLFSLRRNGIWFALIFTFGLVISYGFFETIMKYHIDNFRIFFFLGTLYLSWNYLRTGTFNQLILVTIFLSAQANAHSLGCLLAIMFLGILFVFSETPIIERIKQFALVAVIFLLFGGLHYILDLTIGTGWIFQEVKFY